MDLPDTLQLDRAVLGWPSLFVDGRSGPCPWDGLTARVQSGQSRAGSRAHTVLAVCTKLGRRAHPSTDPATLALLAAERAQLLTPLDACSDRRRRPGRAAPLHPPRKEPAAHLADHRQPLDPSVSPPTCRPLGPTRPRHRARGPLVRTADHAGHVAARDRLGTHRTRLWTVRGRAAGRSEARAARGGHGRAGAAGRAGRA